MKSSNKIFVFMITVILIIVASFYPKISLAENLSATCFANPLAAKVGERIVWTVIPQGGIGSYQYSWSGDDGLFGNSQNLSKIYETKGDKSAEVTVYSGEEFVTPECNVEIIENDPPLSASCFPQSSVVNLSQEVLWTTEARGGDGRYEYSWSGSENLGGKDGGFSRSGRRKTISKNYESTGIKSATVVISSGTQSLSRTCNVTIEPDPILTGVCYPNDREVSVGEPVVWTAEARGGSGEYDYSWSGAEAERGFRRNKQAASTIYENLGQKTVSVSISSGNQSIIEICSVNVGSVLGVQNQTIFPDSSFGNDLGQNGFVSGSSFNNNYGNDQLTEIGQTNEISTTSILSFNWAVFFALSSIFGAILVFLFILIFSKNNRKDEDRVKLAFEKNGTEESISKVIQAEARKNEVIISFEALKKLLDESKNIPSVAFKNLEQIIEEIKILPIPVVPGEDRWPSITKDTVENFFLRKNSGAI